MRVDPQDRADIEFLLKQRDFDSASIRDALKRAAVPPVAEIEAAFIENSIWLEQILASADTRPE